MEPREKAYDAGVFDVAVLNEDGTGELARLGVRFGGDEGEGERGNGLLFLRVRTKRRKKEIRSSRGIAHRIRSEVHSLKRGWSGKRGDGE